MQKVLIKQIIDHFELDLLKDTCYHRDALKALEKRQIEVANQLKPAFDSRSDKDLFNEMIDLTCNAYTAARQHVKKIEAYESYLKMARENSARALVSVILTQLGNLELTNDESEAKHVVDIHLVNLMDLGNDILKSLENSSLGPVLKASNLLDGSKAEKMERFIPLQNNKPFVPELDHD